MLKAVLIISSLFLSASVMADRLYRFEVDGKTVLEDKIPLQYKKLGYEILNSSGVVIKKVPPAPTAVELAAMKRKKAAQDRRKQRIKDRKKKDVELLRLYSSLEDIERSRQRKIADIDNYVILQSKRIESLTAQLDKAEQKAANLERNGREVPVEIRLEIAQLQSQIRESNKNIGERGHEKQEVSSDFATVYYRYRVLQKYPLGTLPEVVPTLPEPEEEPEELEKVEPDEQQANSFAR